MKQFVLLTNVISPHQLPLAREIVRLVGEENFRYIYTNKLDEDHKGFNWSGDASQWCVHVCDDGVGEWLETADVLLSGLREFDLFERRAKRGLKNLYMTERWFKPPIGVLRLLHPRYFCYAWRLCRMMKNGAVIGLPIGIHAAKDMARLCGLMHGDLRCLFGAPEVEFEGMPGGRIFNRVERVETCRMGGEDFNRVEPVETCRGGGGISRVERVETCRERNCLDKMRMWGYFIESSEFGVKSLELKEEAVDQTHNSQLTTHNSSTPPLLHSSTLKVLWVGRLLDWKRVDTIIRAVCEISTRSTRSTRLNIYLDIYGSGPEEVRLKKLAAKYGDAIRFHPPVPIDEVRRLMRGHDVYVLSSNGYEGWGAVVSEALEEGMKVIGTYEAGSSATILSDKDLFHAGDCRRLAELIARCASEKCEGKLVGQGIGEWTAERAAEWLVVSR